MILSNEAAMGAALRTVFTIFAAFWVVVIVGLLLWVGALTKRHDKPSATTKH